MDDLGDIKKYDKENMLGLIESFPKQCLDAKKIGDSYSLPSGFRTDYKNIVFTGLGGSAIGADLIRSYAADEAKIPMIVNRNYKLPAFVNQDTLVIASSYSGNTEETLSAYKDARSKKANIFAVTSGGQLQALAKSDGVGHIIIPKGLPPRCALGYSFFPVLISLSKMDIIKDKSKDIDGVIKLLSDMKEKEVGSSISAKDNISKLLAQQLKSKYPIIYGGQDHIDSVVTRWRGQIAENSKTLASSHIFPEMNHNEIVGWENPKKIFEDIVVIMLRDKADHPRTSMRMDITKTIIKKENVEIVEIFSKGSSLLERIFSLIYIGDFASFYLAILNKIDPTPVDRVTYLKNELAKA